MNKRWCLAVQVVQGLRNLVQDKHFAQQGEICLIMLIQVMAEALLHLLQDQGWEGRVRIAGEENTQELNNVWVSERGPCSTFSAEAHYKRLQLMGRQNIMEDGMQLLSDTGCSMPV